MNVVHLKMKKNILIVLSLLFAIPLNAQLIIRKTYTIQTPETNIQSQIPTAYIHLMDGGFCIGGLIEYLTVPNPQTSTFYRNFVFKIDSSYNTVWVDTFPVMHDNCSSCYDINSVLQSSDSGIIFDRTNLDVGYYSGEIIKNSNDGLRLWDTHLYNSANDERYKLNTAQIINDTILYGAQKSSNVIPGWEPALIGLTIFGDTIFNRDSTDLNCLPYSGVDMQKDVSGNVYSVITRNYQNNVINKINANGVVTETHNLQFNISTKDILVINENRFAYMLQGGSSYLNICDSNSQLIDSVNINFDFYYLANARNGNILTVGYSAPGQLIPNKSNFLELDPTGKPIWGFNCTAVNDSDFMVSCLEVSDSEYVLLNVSILTDGYIYKMVFEKIRKPYFDTSLNISGGTICSGDSILISAPSGYSYRWNTGESTQSIYVKSAGEYFAILSDTSAFFSATASAFISEPMPPYIGNDTLICTAQQLTLDAGSGYVSYLWNDASSSQTLSVTDTTSGQIVNSYYVTVTDTNSCVLSDSINVTIDVCSRINETTSDGFFKVYPNPALDVLNIQNISNLNSEIRIFNLLGKCLLTKMIKSNQDELQLDVSSIPAGIYSIEFSSENNSTYRISKVCLIK